MCPVFCTNTHHDVTDLLNHGIFKNTKTLISWKWNIIYLRNKKILNLCLKWYVLRSYHFLAEVTFKDDLIEYKCLCFNRNYQQKFDEELKEWFLYTYKFSNPDKNKFILMLQKGVYPYEYLDDWEKFNQTSLPEKEDFYSHLNM